MAQAFSFLTDLHQRGFAWLMSRLSGSYERLISDRKEELFGELEGTVLEIGPGTGPNLRYLSSEARWIGVEPNPYMESYLENEAEVRHRRLHLVRGVAETLPLADESVDVAVSTLVLCSVEGPDRALKEIHRVLKPGGRFIFVEHHGAEEGSWLRRVQRWIRPAWCWAADGCRPDRDTDDIIENAGFARLEMDRFSLSLPVVSPHVAGVAWKESGGAGRK
ncbi:MAG: class I SAM-dependent methyltransferase [Longimicrobiales bacterium]|nr:class I SAM-dependent methyltransferase [Longimicrobiales bacterium]